MNDIYSIKDLYDILDEDKIKKRKQFFKEIPFHTKQSNHVDIFKYNSIQKKFFYNLSKMDPIQKTNKIHYFSEGKLIIEHVDPDKS